MGSSSARGITNFHWICVSILMLPLLHRKEESSAKKLLMRSKHGPTSTRRKIQVAQACTKLLFPNALTHTVNADYMLVYSRKFGQEDEDQTMWIRISQPDAGLDQHWFPEESDKDWFVDQSTRKKKWGSSHPAGEFLNMFFSCPGNCHTSRIHGVLFS